MSYTVNTEEIEPCKIKVEYLADVDVLRNKRDEIASRFRKMPIPGFRPGKATDLAIKSHFKDKINELLQQDMLNHAVEDILFETKMDTFANPQALSVSLNGNSFKGQFLFFKTPDFTLGEYKLNIPKPADQDIDQLVEATLQDLRERSADVMPYEENDFVQIGDTITMDYSIFEGENQIDIKEGTLYNVGENLLPDFDSNICGMTAGEEREFALENNRKCKVLLHMGMKKTPAPLDDDLAKRFNLENLEQLRLNVRSSLEQQQESVRLNLIKEQIINRLVSSNQVNLPDWLLINEARNMAAQERLNWEDLNEDARLQIIARAKQAISLVFILNAIRKVEPETELTDMETVELSKQALQQNGIQNPDQYLQQLAQNGAINNLFNQIKNNYVMNWLVNNATITE